MAAYECASYSTKGESCVKNPIKRLEPSIHKSVKVLKIDLERLNKHKHYIEKYQRLCQWDKVNTEQNNASKTVQQLKANMRALERIRNQVEDHEAEQFKEMVCGMHKECLQLVAAFLASSEVTYAKTEGVVITSNVNSTCTKNSGTCNSKEETCSSCVEGTVHTEQGEYSSLPADLSRLQQLPVRPENSPSAHSWEKLQESLVELNGVTREFSRLLIKDEEVVDSAEYTVEHNEADGQEEGYFAQAYKFKGAVLPVAGAVLGGALLGPVGLIAGAKLGSVAAVAGGIAGFTSGTFLKSAQENTAETEMENLNANETATVKTDHTCAGRKST